MTRKIAIIGTAPASRLLAPFDDSSWEIWACSPGNADGRLTRVDLWFEIHALQDMLAPESMAMAKPHFEWLKAQSDAGKFKVMMQERNEHVPLATPFPRDAVLEHFAAKDFNPHEWMTSTPAWMTAYAIMQMQAGDEIAYFGIDMASGEEQYTGQKAALKRWFEIAAGRGIVIRIPKESSLGAQAPLYAYAEGSPFGRRIRAIKALVQAKRAELDQAIQRYTLERTYMDGALEQLNYFDRNWTDGAEVPLTIDHLVAGAKALPAAATADEAGRGARAPASSPSAALQNFEVSGEWIKPAGFTSGLVAVDGDPKKLNGSGGHGAYVER